MLRSVFYAPTNLYLLCMLGMYPAQPGGFLPDGANTILNFFRMFKGEITNYKNMASL